MDKIQVDFGVIKELGVTKAMVLAYIHYNRIRLGPLYGSLIASVLPMGRSTVYAAIDELVTDTYLTLVIDSTTNKRVKKKMYELSDKFYTKFPSYAISKSI